MKYRYSITLLIQFYFSPSFNLSLQSIFHEMISFLQTPLSMAPVVRGGHQRIAIDIAVPEVEDTVHWNEQPVFWARTLPTSESFWPGRCTHPTVFETNKYAKGKKKRRPFCRDVRGKEHGKAPDSHLTESVMIELVLPARGPKQYVFVKRSAVPM